MCLHPGLVLRSFSLVFQDGLHKKVSLEALGGGSYLRLELDVSANHVHLDHVHVLAIALQQMPNLRPTLLNHQEDQLKQADGARKMQRANLILDGKLETPRD